MKILIYIRLLIIIFFLSNNLVFAQSTKTKPLMNILNPDGTINLEAGKKGSFNPKGFKMKYGKNGEPKFVPENINAFAGIEGDDNWDDQFYRDGFDGGVNSIAIAPNGDIYVGGSFSAINGDLSMAYIAKWDNNAHSWQSLSNGMNGYVYAIAIKNDTVYAGGNFTEAGGNNTIRYIAVWNGQYWSSLGNGISGGEVFTITINENDVYVGGTFTHADGIEANRIAKWDINTQSWQSIGTGVGSSATDQVRSIAIVNDTVYAGGNFSRAGSDSTIKNIAYWNGITWNSMGDGVNNAVYSITIFNNDIIIGGAFYESGTVNLNALAKWNGSSWENFNNGVQGSVYNLKVWNDTLYVAGYFFSAGTNCASNHIAKWNSVYDWQPLDGGVWRGGSISAIAMDSSNVYVGGTFVNAGSNEKSTNNFAKWDGSWSSLGQSNGGKGLNGKVNAIAIKDSKVYVGGQFSSAGNEITYNIAMWDGLKWHSLKNNGLGDEVHTIIVEGNDIYVGGEFISTADFSKTLNMIAKWDGSEWHSIGNGTTNGVGSGIVNEGVHSIVVKGDSIYVGGYFFAAGNDTSIKYISMWDGVNWNSLNNGVNERVYAIAAYDSGIYVGGNFLAAGNDTSIKYIASWDGNWHALNGGTNGVVYTIALNDSGIYVGGQFSEAGVIIASRIAKWNGIKWKKLGYGVSHQSVRDIEVSNTDLYVVGYFFSAGGIPVNSIAKWNGAKWSTLGEGVNDYILAIGVNGRNVYVGGTFKSAGGKASTYFGHDICVPEPLAQPTNISFSNISDTSVTVSFSPAVSQPDGYIAIRKINESPDITYNAPIDGILYSVNDSIGDAVVAYIGPDASFEDPGLLPITNYFYDIFSYNGYGSTIDYYITNPLEGNDTTLYMEPLNQPTHLDFSDISLSSIDVSFSPAQPLPNGYLVLRKFGASPDSIPGDGIPYSINDSIGDAIVTFIGNDALDTTFSDTGLTEGTHFYKIFSFNGYDSKINYLITDPLSGNQSTLISDKTGPDISNPVYPSEVYVTDTITVSVDADDSSGVSKVRLYYKISGWPSFSSHDMGSLTGMTYSSEIPSSYLQDNENGLEFYCEAIDGKNNISQSSIYYISIKLPNGIANLNSQPVGKYAFFSIPLKLDNESPEAFLSANSGLEPYDPYQYRWFDVDNTTPKEYPDIANITPGKGFFFITTINELKFNSGSGKSISRITFEPILLDSGWSLIGNPFNFEIPFDSLSTQNDITFELWTYTSDSGWVINTTGLKPWKGYAIQMNQPGEFYINPGVAGLSEVSNYYSTKNNDEKNWLIQIKANDGLSVDNFNFIGQDENALNEYDNLDLHEAPRIGNQVNLIFSSEDTENRKLTTNIHAPSEEGHTWEIKCLTDPQSKYLTLSFVDVNTIPENFDAFLIDGVPGIAYNLKNNSDIKFILNSKNIKMFNLVTGTKEYLTSLNLDVELYPTEFKLLQNFPNPFNPVTIIRYALPQTDEVTLTIYNMLGQKVKTLLNKDSRKAGYHAVIWDGRHQNGNIVASGMYIYHLKTDNFSKSRKMMLIK